LGNAIQSGGNIFGAVLGGGVMLILLEKVGWQSSLICMSVLMFVNLLPILNYSEEFTTKTQKPSFIHSYFQSFISFLSRPKIIPWLLVLLLYMTGDSVTSMMIRPLLVDRGFSLEEIGWILDIFSYGTRMISALVAGLLIVQIGRTKSLMLFGTLAALAILLYIIPAVGVSSIFVIYIVCIIVNATQSMAYTALLSAMMEKCEKSTAATDYTIQVSLMFLGGIGATLVSGTLANQVGYVVVFIVFTFVNLLAILAISKT
jgi:MFS family permease